MCKSNKQIEYDELVKKNVQLTIENETLKNKVINLENILKSYQNSENNCNLDNVIDDNNIDLPLFRTIPYIKRMAAFHVSE